MREVLGPYTTRQEWGSHPVGTPCIATRVREKDGCEGNLVLEFEDGTSVEADKSLAEGLEIYFGFMPLKGGDVLGISAFLDQCGLTGDAKDEAAQAIRTLYTLGVQDLITKRAYLNGYRRGTLEGMTKVHGNDLLGSLAELLKGLRETKKPDLGA